MTPYDPDREPYREASSAAELFLVPVAPILTQREALRRDQERTRLEARQVVWGRLFQQIERVTPFGDRLDRDSAGSTSDARARNR
jgi:hypothetical protein